MIDKEYLEKFKKLYFKKYGIKLTDEQATKDATDLLNLMRILTRPEKKEIKPDKKF